MQTQPTQWAGLLAGSHKTEYRFDINGISYYSDSVQGTPIIKKPLLDVPTIGRVCTGELTLTLRTTANIPKAATVNAYCRLSSTDGTTTTSWIPQGKFYTNSRSGTNPITLNCLDRMIKAGQTYRDKSAFTQWPQTMQTVVNEIASIMGVSIDARTVINTGSDYVVSYPNDDTLISEILGMIGAAHGGNWIMTEAGALRLVPFRGPAAVPTQSIGSQHGPYIGRGKPVEVTRVILVDDADNDFTSGDDTGMTISARCDYATQDMAIALCYSYDNSILNGVLNLTSAVVKNGNIDIKYGKISDGVFSIEDNSISNGVLNLTAATYSNGNVDLQYGTIANGLVNVYSASQMYGAVYEPYDVQTAYLDPCLELGDTVSFSDRSGMIHRVVLQTITMHCTTACTCDISAGTEEETEEEYPYISVRDLSLKRTLKTNQTYYGNRITRAEGFVSELVVNDVVTARLTANAATFAMQSYDAQNGWKDCIYFDTVNKKYVISADVTINGFVTFRNEIEDMVDSDINAAKTEIYDNVDDDIDTAKTSVTNTINTNLATAGQTVINGGNITTGTIDASVVNVTNINASNITTGLLSADYIDTSDLALYHLYAKNYYTQQDQIVVTTAYDGSNNMVLYVGGSIFNARVTYLDFVADDEITFHFGSLGTMVGFDSTNNAFSPFNANTAATLTLGAQSLPWKSLYVGNSNGGGVIKLGYDPSDTIGFYGATPVTRPYLGYAYVTQTSLLQFANDINTALKNLGLIG